MLKFLGVKLNFWADIFPVLLLCAAGYILLIGAFCLFSKVGL